MIDLRYPIGQYEPKPFSNELKEEWLGDIKFLPQHLENAVLNLDAMQLETPYRDGGWTVRQVVHHVSDSHLNALCRLKLTLTEDNPTIRPYEEARWAETSEYNLPINISITMLYTIHAKLHNLFSSLTDTDWDKTYFHPEHKKVFTLWFLLGTYAWHSKHHLAHITSLRERRGW